jgi:CheY-like chemotaxis protein
MPFHGTIVVVDDSPGDVQLLLRTFRQVGVMNPIHVCEGGREALDFLLKNESDPPSVVLLDLRMPVVDGFQVLRTVKSHPTLRDIVVIVLTTSADRYDIQLAYELGANSFLTKPLDLAEFREMVSAFHKFWLIHSQAPEQRGKLIEGPDVTQYSSAG